MTKHFNQIFFLLTVTIFLVIAPWVLMRSAGYRWLGWNRGFVTTSTMVVYSFPRAELRVNGQAVGLTPRRLSDLGAGLYEIELTRAGYGSWSSRVQLANKSAMVVGPVTLYRDKLATTVLHDSQAQGQYLVDNETIIWAINPTAEKHWQMSTVWPTDIQVSGVISDQPISLSLSPNHSYWLARTTTGLSVVSSSQKQTSWKLPLLDKWSWIGNDDTVVWGQKDGHLWRCDIVSRQISDFGPATSIHPINNRELWVTSPATAGTKLIKINNATTLTDLISLKPLVIVGSWELLAGPENMLIIHNQDTNLIQYTEQSWFSSAAKWKPIGHGQKLWWPNAQQPPLWSNGLDLYSWNEDKQPRVLVRDSTTIQLAAWLDDPHLLYLVDNRQVAIKSVSSKQGFRTMLAYDRTATTSPLFSAPAKKFFIIADTTTTPRLLRLGW